MDRVTHPIVTRPWLSDRRRGAKVTMIKTKPRVKRVLLPKRMP